MIDKVELRNWAWANYKGTDLLVVLALVERYNVTEGCAWPSYNGLAAMTGLHRTTVIKTVNRVVAGGGWRLVSKGKDNNSYVPNPTWVVVDDYQSKKGGSAGLPEVVAQSDHPSSAGLPEVVALDYPNKEVNKELNKEKNSTLTLLPTIDDLDSLIAPYQEEKPAPKTAESIAWSITDKCQPLAGGLVRNRKQHQNMIRTALNDGGYTAQQVEDAAVAIASAHKALTLSLLYDVIEGRRTPDGGFINKKATLPTMPLTAHIRETQTPATATTARTDVAPGVVRSSAAIFGECIKPHVHTEACAGYEKVQGVA